MKALRTLGVLALAAAALTPCTARGQMLNLMSYSDSGTVVPLAPVGPTITPIAEIPPVPSTSAAVPTAPPSAVSIGTPATPAGPATPVAAGVGFPTAAGVIVTASGAPGGQAGYDCGGNTCSPAASKPVMWRTFGDFLMLRPRNEGVEYAVQTNGPTNAAPQVQFGPTATVDGQFQAGFRFGFERTLSDCDGITATYTYYRNDSDDGPLNATTPYIIYPMVLNPSTVNAATTFSSASAHEGTSFDLVDLDYRHNLWNCAGSEINYLVGLRYAHLGQEFDATFVSIPTQTVFTNVDFDGFGLRFGLDGRRSIGGQFFVVAKANADFLGGTFGAQYTQTSPANETPIATTTWQDARFVTILEAELGIGWQSCDDRIRATVGYMVNDWLNVVKPSDFISSVQANQYNGANAVGNTSLFFDGLTARVEFTW